MILLRITDLELLSTGQELGSSKNIIVTTTRDIAMKLQTEIQLMIKKLNKPEMGMMILLMTMDSELQLTGIDHQNLH
jgi:hypothetical protein